MEVGAHRDHDAVGQGPLRKLSAMSRRVDSKLTACVERTLAAVKVWMK